MTDEMIRSLSESMERRASRPAKEPFEEMVRRGAIDREGNVILRRPQEPGFAWGSHARREAAEQMDAENKTP